MWWLVECRQALGARECGAGGIEIHIGNFRSSRNANVLPALFKLYSAAQHAARESHSIQKLLTIGSQQFELEGPGAIKPKSGPGSN